MGAFFVANNIRLIQPLGVTWHKTVYLEIAREAALAGVDSMLREQRHPTKGIPTSMFVHVYIFLILFTALGMNHPHHRGGSDACPRSVSMDLNDLKYAPLTTMEDMRLRAPGDNEGYTGLGAATSGRR